MKIPIVYIILGLVVIATIWVTKNKVVAINLSANNQAAQQSQANLADFQKNIDKLTDSRKLTVRGWNFLKDNDSTKAVIYLEQAAKLDKNYRDAAVYLGYARLEEIAESNTITDDDGLIKLTPEQQKQELDEAKANLLAAQKIDPLFPLTNKLLGLVYEKSGNDKEAQVWYARYKEVGGT